MSAGAFNMPSVHGVEPWVSGPGVFLGMGANVRQPNRMANPFAMDMSKMNAGDSPNTQGSRPIPYKVTIGSDPLSGRQSYGQSEPVFFYKQKQHHPLKKAFSLKQLNEDLLQQHEALIDFFASPNRRKRGVTDNRVGKRLYLTEENFTQHIGFGGLVSPAGAGGGAESSLSNPGKTSKLLAMYGKGDIESANLWGGGVMKIPVRTGGTVAFCVKRKNRVNRIKDIKKQSFDSLLKAIGPLEVSPIAANQRHCYSICTMQHGEGARKFNSLISSVGKLNKSSQYLVTDDELFDGYIRDDLGIDGLSRGLVFYTIPGLLRFIEDPNLMRSRPPPPPQPACGIVLEVGIVNEVTTPPPPQHLVASSVSNPNHRYSDYSGSVMRNESRQNSSHALLQKEFFIKLYVYLDRGLWNLDIEDGTEVRECKEMLD